MCPRQEIVLNIHLVTINNEQSVKGDIPEQQEMCWMKLAAT